MSMNRITGDGAKAEPRLPTTGAGLSHARWCCCDDMVADVFPGPGDGMGVGCARCLDIAFRRVGRSVVIGMAVFPQRDAGADRVADHVVLDDPALLQCGADQANLFRRRRRPWRAAWRT